MKKEIVAFTVRFTIEASIGKPQPLSLTTVERIASDRHAMNVHNAALALLRLASQHKRFCEMECSVPPLDDGIPWHKKAERVEEKITALLAPYGMSAVFSDDPRGCTVKLKLPSGYTDDMGREGFCVPQQGLSARQLARAAR